MYFLDTDTVTHLHAGHPRLLERLRRLERSVVATTLPTRIELLRGRFEFLLKAADGAQLLRACQWLARTEELLTTIPIVVPDAASAAVFDRLRCHRKLRKIGRVDLLIASIALAHEATLVTRNVRHFRQISGLKVVNWVDG